MESYSKQPHSVQAFPGGEKSQVFNVNRTRSLDFALTHPFWGLLFLIGILGLALILTYTVALPASNWLYATVISTFSDFLTGLLQSAPVWLRVVLVDGVVAGVGTVLSFIPILLIFFTILGLLEESGYMARASKVTDRYLQWLGLPGKACIPLSMGFGCNTSAILGCRILEDRRARVLTMLLVPFVPCTSRLAVIALLTPAFFGADAMWVTWGLISFNLLALGLVGFTANWLKPRKQVSMPLAFLPALKAPQPKPLFRYIGKNILDFMGKARSLVIVSTLVWTLSYLPSGQIEVSYLARFGQALTPLGNWAGLEDWRFIVALLSSLASKENAVAVLGVLFPLTADVQGISQQVALALSPAARLAFLVAQMLFVPCASTLAAMKQESGSWKLSVLEIALMLVISFLAGVLIYQVGRNIL